MNFQFGSSPVAKLRWALSLLDPVSVAERPRPQGKHFAQQPSDFVGWLEFALCDFNDLQGHKGTYYGRGRSP
jgi:hypothetical protein